MKTWRPRATKLHTFPLFACLPSTMCLLLPLLDGHLFFISPLPVNHNICWFSFPFALSWNIWKSLFPQSPSLLTILAHLYQFEFYSFIHWICSHVINIYKRTLYVYGATSANKEFLLSCSLYSCGRDRSSATKYILGGDR